jgi:gas vesicle protein
MDLATFLNQNKNLIIGITTGTITGIIAGLISAEIYRKVTFKRSKK